jgi:hypothetical protein
MKKRVSWLPPSPNLSPHRGEKGRGPNAPAPPESGI